MPLLKQTTQAAQDFITKTSLYNQDEKTTVYQKISQLFDNHITFS